VRDETSDRIQRVDPESGEIALLRQEIIRCNQLLEEAKRNPTENTAVEIGKVLREKSIGVPAGSAPPPPKGPRLTDADLPFEAQEIGMTVEDLGLLASGGISTLGQTALRATVFGNDSNGIAFTTVSDYSLEFRLGHSTLGVTVALIPERKVHDQSKGIQGVVTRLNKILLDTEIEVELDRPIIVGSYEHPNGTDLVLAIRIEK
ncbi:MAG: hypothetical protein KC931_27215, partial [Candidatus Omnitrophica bacterium]|nr:hypothetical protein [Candidatus Omnitrophota bacterium]